MCRTVRLRAKFQVTVKIDNCLNTKSVLPSTNNKLQDSEAKACQNRGNGSTKIHSRCELVDNIEQVQVAGESFDVSANISSNTSNLA